MAPSRAVSMSYEGMSHDAVACVQGFADVDPWLDGTLRFGGGYSTWSPPANSQMAEVRMHLAPCPPPPPPPPKQLYLTDSHSATLHRECASHKDSVCTMSV